MQSKVLFFLLLLLCDFAFCQNKISLEDALEKLIHNTDEYKNLAKEYKIQTEVYKIARDGFLPKVSLEVNAPTYDHSITAITQPNGEDFFIERQQANSSFVFDISQPLLFSGGYFNLKSSINRIDLMSSKIESYSSTWFNAILIQPLNGFNQFKWVKKINEAEYRTNYSSFKRKVESLKVDIADKYFEILILEKKKELTTRNIELKQKKLSLISELLDAKNILQTEHLQEQISFNQMKVALEAQSLELQTKYQEFRNLFEITETEIQLYEPREPMIGKIDETFLKQRIIIFGVDQLFDTRKILSERDYIKAKRESGIQAELQLAYGLNSNSNSIEDLYGLPSRREFINFQISIPILNWNENKRKLLIAKTQKEMVDTEYKIAIEDVDTRVSQIVSYIKSLSDQTKYLSQNVILTRKNSEIVTYQFEANRITSNDLDYEIFKEMTASIDYLNLLQDSWRNYLNLRRLTLFDFIAQKEF